MRIRLATCRGIAAAIVGATVIGTLLATQTAEAAYTVTVEQVGSDVVATGSGTINLAGLTYGGTVGGNGSFISGQGALIATGTTPSQTLSIYSGVTGPANFGSGMETFASFGSDNDPVLIGGASGEIDVSTDYVSGTPLADSATYSGQSFSSLGVTPGMYVYTFGSGATADSVTVDIGVATSTPEPASLGVLGTGLIGLCLARRGRARSNG